MKIKLILIETVICIIQIVLLFIIPVNSCRNYNCDGKLTVFVPIFGMFLVLLYFMNILFYMKQFFKYKMQLFCVLISIYNLIIIYIIFTKFGYILRDFEIITSLILIVSNSLLLSAYYKIYKFLLKRK